MSGIIGTVCSFFNQKKPEVDDFNALTQNVRGSGVSIHPQGANSEYAKLLNGNPSPKTVTAKRMMALPTTLNKTTLIVFALVALAGLYSWKNDWFKNKTEA